MTLSAQKAESKALSAFRSYDVLRLIFEAAVNQRKWLEASLPLRDPSDPVWIIRNVSKHWRDVAFASPSLWNRVKVVLPGDKHSADFLAVILKRAGENIRLLVQTCTTPYSSSFQRYLIEWLVSHPDHIKELTFQGMHSTDMLCAISKSTTFPKITSIEVRQLKQQSSRSAADEFLFLPLLLGKPATSSIRHMDVCINRRFSDTLSGRQLTVADLEQPPHSARWEPENLCPALTSLRLGNVPCVLSTLYNSQLVSLDFGCCLSKWDAAHCVSDLANVISGSTDTLRTLRLWGWLPWDDTGLLNALRAVRGPFSMELSFYVTFSMMTSLWYDSDTVAYLDIVYACWRETCDMPGYATLDGVIALYAPVSLMDEVSEERRLYIDQQLMSIVYSSSKGQRRVLTDFRPAAEYYGP